MAQSERIKASSAANRFQAVSHASMILFPAVGSWQNLRIRANAKT
jgi:hypothetical protein